MSRRPSNPKNRSEPWEVSNPRHSSEPNPLSKNPVRRSEPYTLSKPENRSEPSNKSNPSQSSVPPREALRALVEIYYDCQDVRIRSFNRLRQVGEIKGVNPDLLKELEKQIRDYIREEIRELPIVKTYLSTVKGIGPILAGGLIAWLDPAKAPHVSSFWKYSGMSVEGGKAVRREKGKKTDYNPRLKVHCWKIGDSFVKSRSPFYRPLYDQAKLEEAAKLCHPEIDPKNCPLYDSCKARLSRTAERKGREAKQMPCKKHVDYRARRKMVKRFLADLWAIWRQMEGLPVTKPYAVAILGYDEDKANHS